MDPRTQRPSAADQDQKNFAERVTEKMQETADDVRSKDPGELLDDARAKTGEAIDTAKQKTSEVTHAAADKANEAMSAAGSQMASFAQTVRERAPAEGRAGEIATNAAEALERSGRYLQEADPRAVRRDLEQIIRDHPIESMLVGLGVGYLLARSMRR
ncbi:MAG: hypothetical protein DIU80_018670 [Chloroflexota bacterium]|nr:MAG: hypothetical protein DIU80_12520 [Chloroflexota bacterium]